MLFHTFRRRSFASHCPGYTQEVYFSLFYLETKPFLYRIHSIKACYKFEPCWIERSLMFYCLTWIHCKETVMPNVTTFREIKECDRVQNVWSFDSGNFSILHLTERNWTLWENTNPYQFFCHVSSLFLSSFRENWKMAGKRREYAGIWKYETNGSEILEGYYI